MTKKKIHGPSVAHDVLDGLGDTALMEKYNLTAKQLESILRRLVDLGLIDPMEMYVRTTLSDSMVTKAFVEKQEAVNELR